MRVGCFTISSTRPVFSLYVKLDEETGSSKSDTTGMFVAFGCLTKVMLVHDSMIAVEEMESAMVTL